MRKIKLNWIHIDLELSGLKSEDFNYEVPKDVYELKERLGFCSLRDKSNNTVWLMDLGGYWIPYPNNPGYFRLKLKSPIEADDGTVKYLSPKKTKGFGNIPYVLPEVQKLAENYSPNKPIFITEGEKKAAKATLEGFPCIGLSGVWCFKDKESDFLPQLEAMNLKHRTIYIVFDSDIGNKVGVQHAELRLAVELINRGSKPLSIRLPNEENGNKNGFDDYLVRHGSEAFIELVEKAEPTINPLIAEGRNKDFGAEVAKE